MGDIFRVILQMSITASVVILAVALLRLLLVRAPRKYSYMLWLIVLVRLICPFCLRTDLSLIPDPSEWFAGSREQPAADSADEMSTDAAWDGADGNGAKGANPIGGFAAGGAGAGYLHEPRSAETDSPAAGGEERQILRENEEQQAALRADAERRDMEITDKRYTLALPGKARISAAAWNVIGWCYFTGVVLSLACVGAGYAVLIRRLKKYDIQTLQEIRIGHEGGFRTKSAAVRIRMRERVRIIETEEIGSPFTVGIFRPTICLPAGLPEMQREMVIAHEHTHIRRKDHLIKMLAAAVRCIHWFNPFVWIAFLLFERDMETSCDEAVVETLGYERKKDYAKTLLSLSGRRSGFYGLYPVSFGEKNTKARIRNVLALKKTGRWAVLISMVAVGAAAVMLLTSRRPVQASENAEKTVQDSGAHENGEDVSGDGGPDTGDGSIEDTVQTAGSGTADRDMEGWSAVLEKIMTRMSEMIQNGTLAEGEIRIEKSEHYGPYEVIQLEDGQQTAAGGSGKNSGEVLTEGGGMLCNPLIGTDEEMREWKDIVIYYEYPLAAQDGKLPLMTAGYGSREHPVSETVLFHSGYDFSAEKGTPVYAAADGVVYRAGYMGQAGNCVILIHANGDVSYYAHCETILDFVAPGTIVSCGQQIATVGNTGASTGPHLHFAVSRDGAYIMPTLRVRIGNESYE